jgi:tRNA/rRNA methyltransferase
MSAESASSAPERNRPRPLHEADPQALARIAFVLMEPSHPGNVGSAARAMKTMGIGELRLVNPRFADMLERPEAIAFASGAGDRLAGASLFPSLPAALADVTLAIAVSAEPREFGPQPEPPEAAARAALALLAVHPAHRVAFVFGTERTGLSIESVQACGRVTSIPASPAYSSLNLAQALQVVAYCLRQSALAELGGPLASGQSGEIDGLRSFTREVPEGRLADQGAVQGLLDHLERAATVVGFLDPDHPKKLMPRLSRLFQRAALSPEEVDLLRGLCKMMERAARR